MSPTSLTVRMPSLGRRASRSLCCRRFLHQTNIRYAVTNFQMPAMSPTMTEGGIASWKKKEGESFSAGDVLLEIETDKATIDVEAQDDGILGKIIAPDGTKNVTVGKVIALLAEEGDDISNLEAPKEEAGSKPSDRQPNTPPSQRAADAPKQDTPPPSISPSTHAPRHIEHSRPLFPSVLRLLQENDVDVTKIKGTGVRGMLTKGDVLAFLGKASSPTGTYKEAKQAVQTPKQVPQVEILDGDAIRRLIVSNLSSKLLPVSPVQAPVPDFESIIADYLPLSAAAKPTGKTTPLLAPKPVDGTAAYFEGLI